MITHNDDSQNHRSTVEAVKTDHIADAGKMIWQPIETAPKPTQRGCRWLSDRVVVWDTQPFIARKNDETGWVCEQTGFKLNPTHWVPLPELLEQKT